MKFDPTWLARVHSASFANTRNWSALDFEQLMRTKGLCLVARREGFTLARQVLDEAEILSIAVLPDERNHGIGRAMLVELEKKLTKLGVRQLFLEVSESNRVALALYGRAGFRETGRRHGYYEIADGRRQDALVLSKKLVRRA